MWYSRPCFFFVFFFHGCFRFLFLSFCVFSSCNFERVLFVCLFFFSPHDSTSVFSCMHVCVCRVPSLLTSNMPFPSRVLRSFAFHCRRPTLTYSAVHPGRVRLRGNHGRQGNTGGGGAGALQEDEGVPRWVQAGMPRSSGGVCVRPAVSVCINRLYCSTPF